MGYFVIVVLGNIMVQTWYRLKMPFLFLFSEKKSVKIAFSFAFLPHTPLTAVVISTFTQILFTTRAKMHVLRKLI